jgi:hypothetical protein
MYGLVIVDTAALVARTRLDVKEARKENQAWHSEEQNNRISKWLSMLNFADKHQDILSKRHPGTGDWILDVDTFKPWREGQLDGPSTLWCHGIREFSCVTIACFDKLLTNW